MISKALDVQSLLPLTWLQWQGHSQKVPPREHAKEFLREGTMMNSKGLSTEPWCTLTLNLNWSLKQLATWTGQRALVYILCTTSLTIHSGTPSIHISHQITFLGTRSNAFSKTTKAMYRFWFAPRYYACSWRTTKMASVIPRYGFNYLYCLSSSILYL